MTEDSSDTDRRCLPRFVRDIGVLGSAGPRQRSGIGVLPTFDGVLNVGVDGAGGIPPALSYLALPEIVARGLHRNGGTGPSPQIPDAAPSSSESRSPDNGADTKVHHVLRSDGDELGDRLRSDTGDSRNGERSAGDGTSSEGTTGRESAVGGTVDERTTAETGRNRSDPPGETTDSTPRVLDGNWDGRGRPTTATARPPTVLATASIPGRAEHTDGPSGRSAEAAPTRQAVNDPDRSGGDARTPVDTERRPGSAGRSETVDHSLDRRDGSDGSPGRSAGGDGTAAADRHRSETGVETLDDGALTVASARRSGDASGSGTTPLPSDRGVSLPDWTSDRRGPETDRGASTPRLTVLRGSMSGDSDGGPTAGGHAVGGGRSGRHVGTPDDGPAGSGSSATGSPGDGSIGTGPIGGPEASSVDRQATAQFPFPRNLSLEGGGPDTRFLEEVYRELTKKMRTERQRGWY